MPKRFLLTAFCTLLAPYCLLLLTSCKDVGVPPDRIISDTTDHGPDTTSHNFTWVIDSLGDASGGTLYDIAIINDTLAYAVGEIYLRDSSGQIDPQAYNVAQWNGHVWNVFRIQFLTVCGKASRTPYPAKAIFAFGSTDIWIAMAGDQITRWNGSAQTETMCLPFSFAINKLWGANANSMYAVGNGGNICYYDGTSWQKIESGTTLHFQDIWGDTFGGSDEILAVASDPFHSLQRYIAKIAETTATALPDSGIPEPLNGVWFRSSRKYYVVGSGIYRKEALTEDRWNGAPLELTPYYSNAVRGTDTNNVVIVGAFADVLHYNGSTWKSYPELLKGDASLYGVSMKGKLVMAVGFWGEKALIIRGTQQ